MFNEICWQRFFAKWLFYKSIRKITNEETASRLTQHLTCAGTWFLVLFNDYFIYRLLRYFLSWSRCDLAVMSRITA